MEWLLYGSEPAMSDKWIEESCYAYYKGMAAFFSICGINMLK